jgi:hypothetical protein
MYSGQNAQNSAVRAAAGGVSNERASRHAKNGIATESAHHSTVAAQRPARSVPKSVMGAASNMCVPGGKKASNLCRPAPVASRCARSTYPFMSE